ncbi:MAG TPA: SRPBCC domain-containing protein [Candidatus Eisenbacteria bacterium]
MIQSPMGSDPDVRGRLRSLSHLFLFVAIALGVLLAIAQATHWPRLDLETHIDIAAPADRVWAIASDLASYPQWNRFMPRATGLLRKGGRLDVSIDPPHGPAMTVHPKILDYDPSGTLRWRGRVLAPGVFDGEHLLEVAPLDSTHARFTQNETFTGILVPFFTPTLNGSVKRGFIQMNEALKRRAEAAYRAGSAAVAHATGP